MERIGVLGTGMVGKAIGSKLVELGYEVKMGSRSSANEEAMQWARTSGLKASNGTFAEAAAHGELVFVCVKGDAALEAVGLADRENLDGKTVIDVTNALDFSTMPPTLFVCNTDSLGERVQVALPASRVVKTLNMVTADVQVDPTCAGGEVTMFVAGNHPSAKGEVGALLRQFGWQDIVDLGDITAARGMEMLLPIWLRMFRLFGSGHFGFKIVRVA
jgi:hypothetical protein